MGSEDYIEFPPNPHSENEEENDGEEASSLQETNRGIDTNDTEEIQEDVREGRGGEKLDLHEECNMCKGKNNFDIQENSKNGVAGPDNVNQDGVKMKHGMLQDVKFHFNSGSMSVAEESEVTRREHCFVGQNGDTFIKETDSKQLDTSSRSGSKRARLSYVDDKPSVHVVYNRLSRESKNKLSELLQQWSEWHSQHAAHGQESTEEPLECGDEIYFPALHVGGENASIMSFWMDKPAKQIIKERTKEYGSQEKANNIPLYDRAYAASSTYQDTSPNLARCEDLPEEDSRCFNCGSYGHSLKDCSKPRDNIAINNARKQHSAKRTPSSGQRCPQRYYQNSPGGKYEGIKAGMLGSGARQSLGIGELDPPPWLNRMREIGYPPGYLDSDEPDEPSGIVIYTDDESMELDEEGEIVENDRSKSSAHKKMTVCFPGINAPIPENADKRLWAGSDSLGSVAGSDASNAGRKFDTRHGHGSSSSLSVTRRGNHFDQTRSGNYDSLPDDPPGTECGGNNAFSSDYTSRGFGGNNSPSEFQHSRMRYPFSRSPSFIGSMSDNGWRSPVSQDIPPRSVHSPGTNSRYGEHGRSPHRQYSPHTPVHHSSSSAGRYSEIQSPGNTDYMLPERRHAWAETYAALDATQRTGRSEGSHHRGR